MPFPGAQRQLGQTGGGDHDCGERKVVAEERHPFAKQRTAEQQPAGELGQGENQQRSEHAGGGEGQRQPHSQHRELAAIGEGPGSRPVAAEQKGFGKDRQHTEPGAEQQHGQHEGCALVASIVAQENKGIGAGNGDPHPEGHEGQCMAARPPQTACHGLVLPPEIRHLGEDEEGAQPLRQLADHVRKRAGDTVDAERRHGQHGAEKGLVGAGGGKIDNRREEYPFAEMDDLADVVAMQDQTWNALFADSIAEGGRKHGAEQQAPDQRPYRRNDVGQCDRQRALKYRAGDVECRLSPELHVSLHHEQGGRLQPGDQEDAADREQDRLQLLAVHTRQGMGEGEHHDGQQGSSRKLECPRGVKERVIRILLGADHALPDADIAEQFRAGAQHVDDHHQPEHLGGQKAGKNDIGGQAQHLLDGEWRHQPSGLHSQPAIHCHRRQGQAQELAGALVHAESELRNPGVAIVRFICGP